MPTTDEEEGSSRRWLWIALVLLIGVVGVGAWWFLGRGGSGEKPEQGEDRKSGSVVASREGADGAERGEVGDAGIAGIKVAPETAVEGETAAADGADAKVDGKVVAPAAAGVGDPPYESLDSQGGVADEEEAADVVEPEKPAPKAKPRASPSKAECEAKRVAANAAKTGRQWSAVLTATKVRSCWSGSKERLARRRLRVEAYAELGNYSRCVKEGGKSSDTQISARVGWCRKKL